MQLERRAAFEHGLGEQQIPATRALRNPKIRRTGAELG